MSLPRNTIAYYKGLLTELTQNLNTQKEGTLYPFPGMTDFYGIGEVATDINALIKEMNFHANQELMLKKQAQQTGRLDDMIKYMNFSLEA
jgi:hypothetical protein